MSHVFESARTGRAKCRGCGAIIAKGETRFGERYPNPFGDGEATLWFHPLCAALKRPEPFLEALPDADPAPEERERLERLATEGVAHRRLPRLNGADRAPTGRARCRSCRELIPKQTWRLALVFYEEGRFEPSGYIHAGCAGEYFETSDVVERAQRFTELSPEDGADLTQALRTPAPE